MRTPFLLLVTEIATWVAVGEFMAWHEWYALVPSIVLGGVFCLMREMTP